jgi:hypothetical protein
VAAVVAGAPIHTKRATGTPPAWARHKWRSSEVSDGG